MSVHSNYPKGFAEGLLVRGMPVLNTYSSKAFWVYNGTALLTGQRGGSDQNKGTFDAPFATLDYAQSQCTANRGDIIMVKAGHAETLVGDSTGGVGVDMDVAGVHVFGLGTGSDRPTFNFTTSTAADFKLAANNTGIHGLLFTNGIDDQAMMIEVGGVDCEVDSCELRNNATTQALILINIGDNSAANNADGCWVHNCRGISDTASATSAVTVIEVQDRIKIDNNYIRGDFSDAGIQSAVIHTDIEVLDNYVQNDNAGEHAIQFSTTGTGRIEDNTLVNDTYSLAIDPGSATMSGNRWSDPAVDTGAIPFPAIGLDGVTSGALPLVRSTGVRYFVDSGHADAADVATYGTSPKSPFLTIDFALTQVTATNGDIIYAMPGHVETMSAAGSCNFDQVAGSTLIGLGDGTAKATFNYTNSAGDIIVSTANTTIDGMLFDMTVATLTMGGTITAADFTLKNCEIITADGSAQATGIFTSNAARSKYHNNIFRATTNSGVASCIQQSGTTQGLEVIGNTFHGDYSDAAVHSASAHTVCLIQDNVIENLNAGEHGIQFTAAATGMILDNRITTDAYATALDKGSCKTHGNLFWDSGNVAVDGDYIPLAGAAPASLGLDSYDPVFGYYLETADLQTPNSASLDMFTVAGGKVMITLMLGTVGTVIEAGANNCSIEFNPSGSSTNTVLNSVKDIDGFDAGVVLLADMAGGAVQGLDAGEGVTTAGGFAIIEAGGIEVKQAATKTGTYVWQLWWKPIDEGALVTVT